MLDFFRVMIKSLAQTQLFNCDTNLQTLIKRMEWVLTDSELLRKGLFPVIKMDNLY